MYGGAHFWLNYAKNGAFAYSVIVKTLVNIRVKVIGSKLSGGLFSSKVVSTHVG